MKNEKTSTFKVRRESENNWLVIAPNGEVVDCFATKDAAQTEAALADCPINNSPEKRLFHMECGI